MDTPPVPYAFCTLQVKWNMDTPLLPREDEASKRVNPCANENYLKCIISSHRMLRRLCLSVAPMSTI